MTESALPQEHSDRPPFIFYMDGDEYLDELRNLTTWVSDLLLPLYGRETTSQQPWCPRWWEHLEAIARLHALWLAWQEYTGAEAGASGPSVWQRDHLGPALAELRSPSGPFAGCKEGSHRAKTAPVVEPYDGPVAGGDTGTGTGTDSDHPDPYEVSLW